SMQLFASCNTNTEPESQKHTLCLQNTRCFTDVLSLLLQPEIDEIDETDTMKFLGFEVRGVIGSGGFGVVKLAKSKKHQKYVAIKMMDCRWVAMRSQSAVLEAEIDIVSKIRHPHIVHVYEVIRVWDKQVYIVMEAAQSSLGEVLKTGPVPSHTARRWFSQLVSALDYMHEQDIVHRDLKCDNILRVIKVYPELCSTFCGTRCYLSPEVLKKQKYDGKKSDVWSLGIVLYVMVTGTLPSYSNKIKELANPKLPFPFPYYVEVEESCRALILDMLQLDPSARPTVREKRSHLKINDEGSVTFTSEDKWSETFTSEDEESETFTSEDEGSVTFTSPAVEVVQEDAGAGITCPAVEVVEERGFGCLGCILPFQAVLKRGAGACAKAFQVLRQRVKRLSRK
ncbi:testis-specific serine/threonine-protein kinase 6-like, partial [Astyanax mexicanus]